MKTRLLCCVRSMLFFGLLVLTSHTPYHVMAQTMDWNTFNTAVFQVTNNAVQVYTQSGFSAHHIAQLQVNVEKLETLFSSQRCPTEDACETIQYMLDVLHQLAESPLNSEKSRDALAFLQVALDDYANQKQTVEEQRIQAEDIPAPAYTPKLLQVDVSYVVFPNGQGKPRQLKNNDVIHSGDMYQIEFRPHEDCFVYLLQVGSSGNIYGLFPLESFRGKTVNLKNPVKADQLYYVPLKDEAFLIDNRIGIEKFYFIASRQRDTDLEREYDIIVKLQNQTDTQEYQKAQNSITASLRAKDPAIIVPIPQKTEAVVVDDRGETFTVLRQRLVGICKTCVNTMVLKHEE